MPILAALRKKLFSVHWRHRKKKHSFCKKNLFQLSMNVGVASELAWNDFPKVSRLNKKHQ